MVNEHGTQKLHENPFGNTQLKNGFNTPLPVNTARKLWLNAIADKMRSNGQLSILDVQFLDVEKMKRDEIELTMNGYSPIFRN